MTNARNYRVTFFGADGKLLAETEEPFTTLMDMAMKLPALVVEKEAYQAEIAVRPTGVYVVATRTGATVENRCQDIFLRHGCK